MSSNVTESSGSAGNQIRIIRKNMALTQNEFAKKFGISQNYVAQIEMGLKTPSVRLLYKIAEESGWRMEDILNGRNERVLKSSKSIAEKNLEEYQSLAKAYSPEEMEKALVFAKTYLRMGR